MSQNDQSSFFSNIKSDFPASIVVFLVALPLCLGIALASGAPLFSGIIAGILGGIVVGAFSGSALGVSGPAAGLAVIVLNAITDLGGIEKGFKLFLVAVILAGILQILMGVFKAGIIAYYFPSSVIHGMLAGIGLLLFFKQLPHAIGYDKDPEGDLSFSQIDHQNTLSELSNMLSYVNFGVIIVTLVSLTLLILWQTNFIKKNALLSLIPGPLLAVISGITLNILFKKMPQFAISKEHLVNLPVFSTFSEFTGNFIFPDFSALLNPQIYSIALVMAVVASLETLLCVEAADKQDTLKRITPTNQELIAQGIGNIISGLIGGLPITQVIVRSSANQQAGGKSKLSAILHGFFILLSIILIPSVLNQIPLATLAAILLVVSYKLAKPSTFKKIYHQGMGQFIPFMVTITGIFLSNLLVGIALGLAAAIFIILKNSYHSPFHIEKEELDSQQVIHIQLAQDVTFLNKASILKQLNNLPQGCTVTIDASQTKYIHHDVMEIIQDFQISSKLREISVKLVDCAVDKEDESRSLQHFDIQLENSSKTQKSPA